MPRRTPLQRFRERAGLSQAELARRSGVPQPTISRIEAGGSLKVATLERLARALGISPRSLLVTAKRR